MDQTVIWDAFPPRPESVKLAWHTVLPRGNAYPFCLGSNRAFTDDERKAITAFCNERFGDGKWTMGFAAQHRRVCFQNISAMAVFVNEVPI